MANKSESNTNTSRRNILRKLVEGGGFLGTGGLLWGGYVQEAKAATFVLRPPGALEEEQFQKACIKCGICVEACPYDTLKLATTDDEAPVGTPYFIPREIPCYMCTDIPCVPVCPTNALSESLVTSESDITNKLELNINIAEMGLAVVDTENCLAFWGIRCDACYRACPLIDEAITLDIERNERTGKHAMIKPLVHNDICTGCGMCEHACITEKASITILPKDKVQGKVADHYLKGWDKSDETRIDTTKVYQDTKTNKQSTLDYLNDTESILNDE